MKKYTSYLIIASLCLFTFFVNNGFLFTEIMESRNIITAREMVYDNHWMVPTMNGEIRLQKPPLPTWLAAVAEMIAPDNIAVQRSMSALAATFLVLMLYLIAVELTSNKRYGLISTILLCTSYNIIMAGRTASWDIYCHAFMTGAILFLIKAVRKNEGGTGLFAISGFLTGLSFMSKGPISLYGLFLPFLISYFVIYKNSLRGKWKGIAIFVLSAIIVGGWWYLYVYLSHPEQFLKIVGTESQNWTNYHTRPWYYYYDFAFETGIWTLLCITSLFWGYWRKKVNHPKGYSFALLWMILVIVCLSILPEKKTRYLLPMLIPAAMTMGYIFDYWASAVKEKLNYKKWIYYLNTLPIAIMPFIIPIGIYLLILNEGAPFHDVKLSILNFSFITVVSLTIGIYMIKKSIVKPDPMKFLGGIAALFVLVSVSLMPLIAGAFNNPEFNGLDRTRNMPEVANLQFYYDSSKELRIEQVYDAHRIIKPLNIKDSAAVASAMPCVILTHGMADTLLAPNIKDQVKIKYVGQFDGNRGRKKSKFNKQVHTWDLSIIEPKNN
ncbi:MAG: glycosyltransferase family 39 protein [Bacteroidales bacterium]|nr:glycosyltransferase family 39 protein [Bacteroidales bacterium]